MMNQNQEDTASLANVNITIGDQIEALNGAAAQQNTQIVNQAEAKPTPIFNVTQNEPLQKLTTLQQVQNLVKTHAQLTDASVSFLT